MGLYVQKISVCDGVIHQSDGGLYTSLAYTRAEMEVQKIFILAEVEVETEVQKFCHFAFAVKLSISSVGVYTPGITVQQNRETCSARKPQLTVIHA